MENRSMPPGILIIELVYPDLETGADWLCRILGFTRRMQIGSHRIQLVLDGVSIVAVAGSQDRQPARSDHSIMLRIVDIDRHYAHARNNGALILQLPTDYPYGERQYSLRDPGGHVWTLSETVADVDPQVWGAISFAPGAD